MIRPDRATFVHIALLIVLFLLQFALPDYYRLILTRVMVLAPLVVGISH